jgi:serine/threonine-protein kinase HipA
MAKADTRRDAYEVHLDAAELGIQRRVGILYRHAFRTDLPASFEYDEEWLKDGSVFMLDPRLDLWSGEQHPPTGSPAFGILTDSAPDRWGRLLMERREAASAEREGRRMRNLQEVDFLLGVNDLTRMGALRFRSVDGGPFLDANDRAAPPVTSLRELAYISQRVEEPGIDKLPEYAKWLAMLIAPGTSLGGARPKASFTAEDGRLWIAKFPSREDRYDVGAWEFLVHRLAKKAGIWVPDSRIEHLTDRYSSFCVSRFDRIGESRRMFASAMTLLDYRDGKEGGSYVDLAEFITDHGGKQIDADLHQLFRRVVFNVLVGNRDDHLRNHGFIRERTGWRLAPAYDMNPNPSKTEHSLTLDGRTATPNLRAVVETASLYRLEPSQTNRVVTEVKQVVADWRREAESIGIARSDSARIESVFQVD